MIAYNFGGGDKAMSYALKCEVGLCNRESIKTIRVLNYEGTSDWDEFSVCSFHLSEVEDSYPSTSIEVVAHRRNWLR